MSQEATFADRLKVLIGEMPANRFAREVSVGESLIRKYLAGATPGVDKVVAIAEAKEVSLDWLARGVGPMKLDVGEDGPASGGGMLMLRQAGSAEKFALVPRLDIQASAGNGRIAISEEPLEYLAFQAAWLRGRGINPASARILTARGDSMEETIRDGDVLLVDTSIDRVRDNSIYVVVYGDMVLVKRVHGRINGSLQLISDNPRYPAEEVPKGEVDQLHVAGRVAWYGRSI
ncbi:helix-turn-helix transcriptional regulator [Hoeflea alexandrii]|uniref:LexA family transcriptional regulator n=1 Tax=Hoeflea alexandrii TaxID=288436 RepID=UPI0035D04E8D